ncbi:MAG: ATP-grasp domain-containing protein, partial [Chloroflexi bacterium]|nr:ATP-grasp domain-containing protein [Chloroflexota bacterium]
HDLDKSTRAIAEFVRDNPVQAVLSADDSATVLAARAGHTLGLRHNSPEAAEAARDKHLMRQLFAEAGVPSPRFKLYSLDDDVEEIADEINYPCVIKPLTLSGSRGVIRADSPLDFIAAHHRLKSILNATGSGEFLVEDFIPGFEVALEGLMNNGELTVLALFDKPDPLDGPYFEETIYVTPSRLSGATQQAIADCASRAAIALGLREGPIHAELRINEQAAWMVEVAGRSIGGLCSQTLRFGTDVSLEELILRQACGLEIPTMEREKRAGGVMMIPIPAAGILREVEGVAEADAVPGIESIEITAKLNYMITPLPEGESYLGFIFARGESPAEVEWTLREAHRRLNFRIEPEIALATV